MLTVFIDRSPGAHSDNVQERPAPFGLRLITTSGGRIVVGCSTG